MVRLLERDVVERVRRTLLSADAPVVLAVSGGVDSMVLLDAAARAEGARIAAVATFDHGTGSHAARAAAHVGREAHARGLPVAYGRATSDASCPRPTEASWRAARHRFLADVASRHDARIATGHTRDDQVETVLMRVLRGSGARGLAGLAVKGSLLRPLLELPREVVERYARARPPVDRGPEQREPRVPAQSDPARPAAGTPRCRSVDRRDAVVGGEARLAMARGGGAAAGRAVHVAPTRSARACRCRAGTCGL
jgi:tRNA(Ile)-lysidine synthase